MIRKLFSILPTTLQERIKLFYYNKKIKDFGFTFNKGIYKTFNEEWSVKTYSPLYFIVKDVKRYENFYKVSQNDIVFDAGANEGILSLIYAHKVGIKGFVYAFEPDTQNLKSFSNNLALNKGVKNINISNEGFWKHTGYVDFFETGTVGSSILYVGPNARKNVIAVTTIDDFVLERKIKKLDFIKMDIEGAEVEAVMGAENTIKSLRPNFAIASYHKVNNEFTFKAVETIFKNFDYPYKTLFYKDGEIITYAGPMVLRS